MPERIVIDTSVLVAACKSADGGSRSVLRLCFQEKYLPLVGVALFLEYEEVLNRTELFRGAVLNADERNELLDALLSVSEWTPIFFLWRPNLRDEGDNHLIELAIAGGATKVITHNKRDLFAGELKFPQLKIMTPAEFLNDWRRRHGNDDDSNS